MHGEGSPIWFEVNWNVADKEDMIELSTIKNEEGDGKEVWNTFPKKGRELNYFMPASLHRNRGIWKLKVYK